MIQLQFRITHEKGHMMIVSDTLVDGNADELELRVARAINKVHNQVLEKAAKSVPGVYLNVSQDRAAQLLRGDGNAASSDKQDNTQNE